MLNRCVGIMLFLSLVNGYPSDKNGEQCFNYCSNDAVCLTVNNNRQCYCLPEWDGQLCDIPRTDHQIKFTQNTRNNLRNTPCTYVPTLCKNGGICYFDEGVTNKVACQCPYPYDGPRCEEYSLCYNFCMNDGICTITGKTAKCECKEGFAGDRCNERLTTTPAPTTTTTTDTTTTDIVCSYLPDGFCNTGQCVVNGGRATCQCPSTHTGEQCDIPTGATQRPGQTNPPIGPGQTNPPIIPGQTNPPIGPGQTNPPSGGRKCSDNPCRNNRPCYNNGNSYFCDCGSQFTGNDCEAIQG